MTPGTAPQHGAPPGRETAPQHGAPPGAQSAPRPDAPPAAPPRARVALGIDLGSTGLRALFAAAGQPRRAVEAAGPDWPWLLCEPAPAGVLPVSFPSLKSLLGSGRSVRVGGVAVEPDDLVTRLLRMLRRRVEAETSATVAQTVISVPASFRSAQRAALRDAAHAAGLSPARLISDSMAAVIGHTTDRDSATCLVYAMGYEGFEIGLVRGVRGHYRALGYEGAATSGGRALDREVLTSAVRLLLRDRGPAAVAGLDTAAWYRLRARAQEVREELSRPGGADAAELALGLGDGPPLWARFERPDLDAHLDRHVRRALERAHTLLDQSGMAPSDVDTLLLVGGTTRMERVSSGVRGLGRDSVTAPPELLALGALKHASRLAGGAPSSGRASLEEGPLAPADPADDTLSDAPPLAATLHGASAPEPTPDPTPDGAPSPYPRGAPPSHPDGARSPYPDDARSPYPDGAPPPYSDAAPPPYPDSARSPYPDSAPLAYPDSAPPPYQDSAPPPYRNGESPPYPDVERARALAREGRREEAVALLQGLIAHARTALDELHREPAPENRKAPPPTVLPATPGTLTPTPPGPPAPPSPLAPPGSPTPPGTLPPHRLARAQALLKSGRFDQAVQASHLAWQGAAAQADGADALDAMVDVHCAAAMADSAPEHFADAERWLRCAYSHAPTNVRVRGLLAERTFRHAVELHRRGSRDDAIEALGKCLTWDPEHADAEALLRRLTRDARNRRGRGDVLG